MKCLRCGIPISDNDRCPCCGADSRALRENTFYLLDIATSSSAFASLHKAATVLLIVLLSVSLLSLLAGSVSVSLPTLLSAIGVLLLGKKPTEEDYASEHLSPAPARLFTASAVIRLVTGAFSEAACIAVCLGGRNVIDSFLSYYESFTGVDFYESLEAMLAQTGTTVSLNENAFYLALYFTAVFGMFLFAVNLTLNTLFLIFFRSYRASVKSGKLCLVLFGFFSVMLLVRAVISFLGVFSFSLLSMIQCGVTGYFYLTAYLFTRRIRQALK